MANSITLSRLPLLGLILMLMFWSGVIGRLVAVPLILILILMDSLDGFIARRRNETSLLGSALDIATDRAVELVLWVSFASLDLIPLIIPLIVIVRGTLTDSIRAVASSHGVRAYDMHRSRWTRFLVTSSAMRSTYGVVKAIAFCVLAFTLAVQTTWGSPLASSIESAAWTWVYAAGQVFSWAALLLCLARGIPVLIEAPGYFKQYQQDKD